VNAAFIAKVVVKYLFHFARFQAVDQTLLVSLSDGTTGSGKKQLSE
jgi:hypothetical protein